MKKRILISLSSAVVLVALAIFVIAQTSGTNLLRADKSSACSDTEVVMTSAGGCCSSSAAAVQTAAAKSSDCSSVAVSATAAGCSGVVQTALEAGCTGVIQTAVEAGCTGVTNVTKGSECSSEKTKEDVSVVMVSNTKEASETACCEGSATAALLIDECCGSCI